MKFTFAPESKPLEGYTIKRAIHRGGFGEVYYALSDAGKEVALKLLNNNLEVELRGVSQCLNLKHPNLVTIFDIREDADRDHWIVMEYVAGKGLYETLQEYPSGMPISEILHWLDGMSAGLSFLHDRGIVHRDLKPANVFADQGVVKIGDVGLSKYISESGRSAQTQSVGTVYYMAPEVAKGRYGREVDVYAMGVMLYEMLTGNVPFDGQTTAEILMKHMTAEPDLSVVPDALRPVLAAALEKDPDRRIADIDELARQFRLCVAGQQSSFSTADSSHAESTPPRSDDRQLRRAGVLAAVATLWSRLPAPAKWIAGGAVAILTIESGLLRQVAIGGLLGGFGYLCYLLVHRINAPQSKRATAHTPQQPPRPEKPATRAVPIAAYSVQSSPRPQSAVPVYEPTTIRRLTIHQRASDVGTSLSLSLVATALVTVAVFLTTDLLPDPQHAVYFGTITMLAAGGLMLAAKSWEGKPGDSFTRRLAQGTIGLGVGYLAAVLHNYLMIDQDALFHVAAASSRPLHVGRITVTDGSGYPTMACFMIFFASLFMIRRWWWQADSFRKSRFRVSSALVSLFCGIVLTAVLPDFPDTLGATWALAISAVIQLSAGWTPPESRRLESAPSKSAPLRSRALADTHIVQDPASVSHA